MSRSASRAAALEKPAATANPPSARSSPQAHRARRAARSDGAPVVRLSPLRPGAVTNAPPGVAKVLASSDGAPLAPSVRQPLEESLGVDLGAVRIHQAAEASALVDTVGARAFAIGPHVFLGRRERPTDLALVAHEVAHVVQQQGGEAGVQAYSTGGWGDPSEREAQSTSAAVVRGEPARIAQHASPQPQFAFGDFVKSGISAVASAVGDVAGVALDFIRDKARLIPGYDMAGFILGRDPITQKPVARNAVNLIKAVMGLWPGGTLVFEALQSHGIIDKVGAWLEQQLAGLVGIIGGIRAALDQFIKTLGPGDVLNLTGAWERAKRIFTEPIDRARQFVGGLATSVLGFIRDAILMPIGRLAQGTRGYDLLKAVLGKDPVTGQPVPQDAATLIGGFMKLIGEEEIWNNLQKSNAVPRAFAWFKTAMAELKVFVAEIPPTFIKAFKSLQVVDLILVPRAFAKIASAFGNFIGRFLSWAGGTVWKLLEIIFEVVSPAALGYIKKTGAALKSILKNPMPFVGNLVKAAKRGFEGFADRIWEHLKAGLIDWLLGALPGVYIPKAFALGEIVKFVFSVLGLTWQNVRTKLVVVLGETVVKAMETGFKIVVTLVRDGPAAAWAEVKAELANLKDQVIDGIIGFVVDTIVKKAIPKLIAMFIPGAGFISAILSIYDTVMVFVNKIAKIIQVVKSFIDSIVSIAAGQIDAASKRVESILAGLLSLAISFLAGFLGLGNVADKLMGVIKKVRGVVDKALDAMIKWIVTMAKKLFSAAKAGVKKLFEWWKQKKKFKVDDETHELSFRGQKSSAALVVASNPKLIEDLLTEKATTVKSAAGKKAITEIRGLLKQLKPLLTGTEDQQEKNKDKITGLFNDIGAKLVDVMSDQDWGSADNPLLLAYPKPRVAAYAPIFLGPFAKDPVSQTKLAGIASDSQASKKTAKSLFGDAVTEADWAAVGKKVTKFVSTEPGKDLPGDNGKVGVDADKQVQVGLKFEYEAGKTGGGAKLNNLLKPYGYRPKADDLDADHVIEIQLIGRDKGDYPGNMWPLRSKDNRHGLSLAEADVELGSPSKKTMKLSAAAKKKPKPFVMIKSTTYAK